MRPSVSGMLKWAALAATLALAACGSAPVATESAPVAHKPAARPAAGGARTEAGVPALPPANSGRGAYYQDDGPGDAPPPNLADVPDAEVRNDPLLPRSNRPYVVFGKTYTPVTDTQPYSQIGTGSWYGKKFHGQRTSSGELYDMYKMTAAHPTLPIPSYARLTNMLSGAVVIVRINDRGPFHANRAIDVSYTAALKLGLLGKGSHELLIERILPDEIDRMLATREGVSASKAPRLPSQLAGQPALQQPLRAEPRAASGGLSTRVPAASPLMAAPSLSQSQPLVLAPRAVSGGGLAGPAIAMAVPPAVSPTATAAPASAARGGLSAAAIEAMMLADRPPSESGILDAEPAGSATLAAAGGGSLTRGGYYLQLGAYSRAENADAVRNKLGAIAGLGMLEVVRGGAVHRLFSGPFATRQEAQQAGLALPAALGLKPIVVQR